jgi:hypothetical protein
MLGLLTAVTQSAPIIGTARADSPDPSSRSAVTSGAPLRTKTGYLACLQKQWLSDFMQLSVAGDNATANAYIESHRCVPVRGGLVVTQSATPNINGTVSYLFEGVEFWTVADAVER